MTSESRRNRRISIKEEGIVMKRTLSVLLIVALLLSAFTACSVNQNITDELVSVSLRTQGNERSLTAGVDFDVSKVTTWKYTAVKADNGLSTGATGRGETNAVPLTDGKTKALSQGSWNFELFGYTSDNKLICSGEVSAVTITLDKTSVTITVRPSQTADGKGKIVISEDIRIVDENGTVYSSTTGEYTKTVTVKNSEGKEITELDEVSSGLYTVTVSFTGTAKDGTSYTAGSKTKYINVYDNLTTTVSGTVEEDSSSATMTAEGGAVKAASEPVSVTKNAEGKNEANVDVPVKSTASSDATKETTISFPANSLKMDESATAITVTMQSSSIENVSTTYEIESDEGAAVAGFDFTLEGADSSKFETDEGVLVTTYISAGLGVWDSSNPTLKIKYIGSSSGTEPKIEFYDNATGELKFRVYHFSKYCIISTDKVVAIKNGGMYDDLPAAITAANNGDTIILLKDVTISEALTIGKKLDINLNTQMLTVTKTMIKIGDTDNAPGSVVFRDGRIGGDVNGIAFMAYRDTLVFDNITIDGLKSQQWGIFVNDGTWPANLEIRNSTMRFDSPTGISGIGYATPVSCGYVKIENSSITANDVALAVNEALADEKVEIVNSKFYGASFGAVLCGGNYIISSSLFSSTGSLSTDESPLIALSIQSDLYATKVTLDKVKLELKNTTDGKAIEVYEEEGCSAEVTGTLTADSAISVADDSGYTIEQNTDKTYTVVKSAQV